MRHTGRGLQTWEGGWRGHHSLRWGPAWVADVQDYPGERGEPGLEEGLLTLVSQGSPPGPTPVWGKTRETLVPPGKSGHARLEGPPPGTPKPHEPGPGCREGNTVNELWSPQDSTFARASSGA